MTIADQARNLAISLEAKKDALSQRQSGDWKVSFTVQDVDMDPRFTSARMGTRYAMVLVEIGDDELPIPPARKEAMPNSAQLRTDNARLQPTPDKSAGAKREKMDWRDVQPAAQAGIRCGEPSFRAFLEVEKGYAPADQDEAAEAVRDICGVKSRADLGTVHAARMIWHALDAEYQAWKELEHA